MTFRDFKGATQKPARLSLRIAALAACAFGSFRLYRELVRIVPKMTSAEPTNASQILPWVKAMTHATLDSIQHKTHGLGYTVEFLACCAGLFALYGIAAWLAKGVQSRWFALMTGAAAAVFMGALVCSPAMLSSDVYAYAHYGRLLAAFGVDAHGPAAIAAAGSNQDDPFSLNGYYDFVASVYGPLWTVISAGLVLAGRTHVGLTVLLFRSLEAASALGTGALIWAILRRLSPERAAFGMMLFLWNPLVVIESALSGHNDACMMLLALLAAWLHLRGWKVEAVVALTLSALVKVITAPLIPLYILVVLRKNPSWKEGAWFLCRACLAAAAVSAISVFAARMNPNGLITQTAASAQFYENNYHEPLFKGLRRLLGEPPESIEIPTDFRTWWVKTNSPAVLHAGISNKSQDLCRLKTGQELLAISDEDSDFWLRVYDPANGMEGYVHWLHLSVIDDPPDAYKNPMVRRISGWPPDWPTVIEANQIIRVTTWSLFIAFGLLTAWKTVDFESFVIWGASCFIAADLLVFTKIWPWYAIWPLALGALKPESAPMRLAVWLSAGMLTMYAFLDYCTTQWDWLYNYRSIPTIVLPVALYGIAVAWGLFQRRRTVAV
jgi:hypothetical protein